MSVRHVVRLTDEEREQVRALVSAGRHRALQIKRAQILLAADGGVREAEIARTLGAGKATVYRIKRRYVEGGLANALHDAPRPGGRRKLSGKEEALLIATACSAAPEGRSRWTLELLAQRLVALTPHASVSRETIRRRLEEKQLKPWQKKMWCVPKVDAKYVARMEDVLDLYAEDPDAEDPVVCFDESPVQLLGETRLAVGLAPGRPPRIDYEYCRNGTANLFIFVDAHRPWRHVKVTDRRTCVDFAECMRELVDVHYPKARRIRVVLDNLSSHSMAALYEAFPPDEARRILRRIELHYVPTHASWLNMVEIEIGVLKKQCLDRRIGDAATLAREIAAWEVARNAARARIRWLFTVDKAREKMGRAYPPQVEDVSRIAA